MTPTPVVQVRLPADVIEFLDSLPGTRSEAIRYCVDFTHGAHMTPGQIDRLIAEEPVPEPRSRYADMSPEQLRREMKR